MKATILQPTYLPWSGFFEMISSTDLYVVFDHVQFERKSWQQRNRIKTANGEFLLTIPVKKTSRNIRICDVEISYDHENPLEKHWKTITLAYQKAPYFNKYKKVFENIFNKKPVLLRELNVELIKAICDILNIKINIKYSSDLDLNDKNMERTEKVVNLCKKAGISHLYDAKGAQKFLDTSLFEKEGIAITFQNFTPPQYNQSWGDFIPFLSVIDLIFNEGEKSMEIIKSGRGDI
ncbi:MAG: WbqC family protein [Candidatus Staskawiczbacteria bacterium]|nr:WbqC family protein [Candidatus Staskawiczbacteria bacterium]